LEKHVRKENIDNKSDLSRVLGEERCKRSSYYQKNGKFNANSIACYYLVEKEAN